MLKQPQPGKPAARTKVGLDPVRIAIGGDREGARKAGINVEKVTFAVYCLCGAFAAVGGFISLSQTAAAPSTFDERILNSAVSSHLSFLS